MHTHVHTHTYIRNKDTYKPYWIYAALYLPTATAGAKWKLDRLQDFMVTWNGTVFVSKAKGKHQG